jgi:hypothetical protein
MTRLIEVVKAGVDRLLVWARKGATAGTSVVGALDRVRGLLVGEPSSPESWLRTVKVGGLSLAVVVLCGIAFVWRAAHLGASVPDGRVWYTAAQLGDFLACIGGSGRILYALTQLSVDVVFPLAYASLLTVLIERIWRTGDLGLLWLAPLLAAVFDLLENLALASLAFSYSAAPPAALVAVAASFTLVKFVLVGVSVLLLGGIFAVGSPRWVHLLGLPWLVLVGWALMTWTAVALVPVLPLAIVVHRRWMFLFQYLFFLRFVLLAAASLALFPSLAGSIADGRLLRNLFVVESWGSTPGWVSVLFVSFLLGMLVMTLMWATRLVILTVPARYRLPLARSDHKQLVGPGSDEPPEDRSAAPSAESIERANEYRRRLTDSNRRFVKEVAPNLVAVAPVGFALLAWPFVQEMWRRSGWSLLGNFGLAWRPALALAAGIGFWILVAYGIRRQPRKSWRRLTEWSRGRSWAQYEWVKGLMQPGAHPLVGFGGQGHVPVLVFVGVVAAFYALGWLLLDPGSPRFPDGLPAVGFVLLIAVVAVWGLSMAALILDVWRVPVMVTLLVALFVAHRATHYDHYFDVVARPSPELRLPTATEAFDAWRDHYRSTDFVTVVAASGGGIKASLWTARVLQALATEELGRSILLLSTNSGGSVGGMYFTDAFAGGPPDKRGLEEVVRLAGSSSLTACAWAMAYRDLWHFLVGGLIPFGPPTHDRGWAMDRRWELRRATLAGAGGEKRPPRRLGDWARDVGAGLRPAHIFNATAVESGAAFRLASVDLGRRSPTDAPGSRPHEFWDFFEPAKADIEVATAARLSASFPWVSPMGRAWGGPGVGGAVNTAAVNAVEAFRLADGGYFDNFGVFSTIEFLKDIGPTHLRQHGIQCVLFVQIRATPEGSAAMREGGIQYSLVGPFMAMNSVLNSSQVARNDLEVSLLRDLWARNSDPVEVLSVVFDLCSPGPLSWHLTQEEGDDVIRGWGASQEETLGKILLALKGEGAPPEPAEPCTRPAKVGAISGACIGSASPAR